jgi:2-polyprenyl-3-methyl-5-hydroxy-6-metoxy-1,4-benzoquinol methylase
MLSRRYDNDELPTLKLNELQWRMKRQVERKVKDGSYEFEEVPCPVCDGSDFELLAKKDRYGLQMSVVICRDCGLIQTNPRMNQTAYNEFYDSEYRELYGGEENPTDGFFQGQYNKGRRIFGRLRANGFLETCENMLVLEVGCGAGGILQYFKEKGCRVKGIDLGKSYIEYGRDRYDLDLSVGALNSLDLGEAPNVIIYSHVLEHVLTPNEELQRAYDVLSDTGLMYIEVPGVRNLLNSYEMDFLMLLQNAHICHFTLGSLSNLLVRNGFELLIGDEVVGSIFRKAQGERSPKEAENEYAEVLAYLRRVERLRALYPIPPYKIRALPRSIVVNILEATGLFESAQNLYHRAKRGFRR